MTAHLVERTACASRAPGLVPAAFGADRRDASARGR